MILIGVEKTCFIEFFTEFRKGSLNVKETYFIESFIKFEEKSLDVEETYFIEFFINLYFDLKSLIRNILVYLFS